MLTTISRGENRKIAVLVEAKYLSEKSSEADAGAAPKDQLAMEYDNLQSRAKMKTPRHNDHGST